MTDIPESYIMEWTDKYTDNITSKDMKAYYKHYQFREQTGIPYYRFLRMMDKILGSRVCVQGRYIWRYARIIKIQN
jgi:hypothetical protein